VKLLREKKGSVVLGRQVGNVEAGERVPRTNEKQTMFRHNEESFKQMWVEVGEATGTTWSVDVEIFKEDRNTVKWNRGPDERSIRFSVWRE
jgi:hypothetical protein